MGARAARFLGAMSLVVAVAAWLAALPAPLARAHIANEKTQFPDIGATPEAPDIVLLVALGVIPQTPVFEPDAKLTRRDLAAWAALAHREAQGGEAPDVAALVQAGARHLTSLAGDATLADIDRAIFDGRLHVSEEGSGPITKAAAAAYIASHLDAPLLEEWGVTAGPTGRVDEVKTETSPDGDASYTLVIARQIYPVYEHARVVGPTDLTLWQDRTVVRSYLEDTDSGKALVFAQVGPPASEAAASEGRASETAAAASPAGGGASPAAAGGGALRVWPWLLGLLALLVLIAVVVLRRRA